MRGCQDSDCTGAQRQSLLRANPCVRACTRLDHDFVQPKALVQLELLGRQRRCLEHAGCAAYADAEAAPCLQRLLAELLRTRRARSRIEDGEH